MKCVIYLAEKLPIFIYLLHIFNIIFFKLINLHDCVNRFTAANETSHV